MSQGNKEYQFEPDWEYMEKYMTLIELKVRLMMYENLSNDKNGEE